MKREKIRLPDNFVNLFLKQLDKKLMRNNNNNL